MNGRIGRTHLSKVYGGRKNNGFRPSKTVRGSIAIATAVLKQLESARILEKHTDGYGVSFR